MHPQARLLLQQRRAAVLHAVHGEIHVSLEHGQQPVHYAGAAGGREEWGDVLDEGFVASGIEMGGMGMWMGMGGVLLPKD